jgi:hemoglobin-like flavoprotein
VQQFQITIVQQSWQSLAGIKDQVGGIFYGKLFKLDPTLRALFRGDIEQQGHKLVAMIDAAVAGLDNTGALIGVLVALGQRHKHYGVVDQHYDTVAAALLETLAAGLGENFTAEVQAAWVAVYNVLSSTMKSA